MEQFIGVAQDGYPIYGPYQADLGRDATNDDLDECHGRQVGEYYRYVFPGKRRRKLPLCNGMLQVILLSLWQRQVQKSEEKELQFSKLDPKCMSMLDELLNFTQMFFFSGPNH